MMTRKIFALYTLFSFSLVAFGQIKTDGVGAEIDGKVRLSEVVHDFGDVVTKQGPLTCTFTVENISSAPIAIYNVASSCGCTDVTWTREPIRPGAKGFVKATYTNDEGPYPFDKTLTAYISGLRKPVVLRLRGVAHDKKLSLRELYPIDLGGLGFRSTDLNAGNLSQGGQRGDAVRVANLTSAPVRVSFYDVTSGLSMHIEPNPVPAGGESLLSYVVTADRARWGENFYTAVPVVNGKPCGRLKVRAFTKEDFSSLTPAQKEAAPCPVFSSSAVDIGNVRRGTMATATFDYRNTGESAFHIYKVDTDSNAVSLSGRLEDTPSGGEGSLSFGIDTGMLPEGDAEVVILLTTNSAIRPVISLYINGNVI
mgnify:FL=1